MNGARFTTSAMLFAFLAFAASVFFLPAAHAADAPPAPVDAGKLPTEMPGYSVDDLRRLSDIVTRTGLDTDKIPALFRPSFLSISDADLSMDNDDIVFVVHYPDDLVRIYPRRVLVWHEAVNDTLPDPSGLLPAPPLPGEEEKEGIIHTISYSPLTGSVVGFRSMAGRYPSSFGLSGILLNGNSVLYDRISRSLWVQLMAVCIEGPFRGKRLQRIPVLSARWKGVKQRYGGLDSKFKGRAEVLSRSTGFRRSYGKDPYGSYGRRDTYYDDTLLPFPVDFIDTRLHPKKRILGLEVEEAFGAVVKDEVRKERVINFSLGNVPMVAFHDREMDAVRVFERGLPDLGEPLRFTVFEDRIVDEQSKSHWLPDGDCVYGRFRDRTLKPVLAVDSMWFAWASFYRRSRIIPGDEFRE
ncbi:MAG: DUF3179 domain-containing protein [Desulfovibrio sp.]|jgi:hypothetical protein|nr:DUF3179 domain-containing protein [Desulfovibrio sp.]